MERARVLIVGAGPTGMMAAVELTRLGIPVRLVERAAGPSTTSRALAVQARTLELFEQRQMLAPMLDKGNPVGVVRVFGDSETLFTMDLNHNGTDFPYMLLIPQSDTEQVLREELGKLGVSIEWETQYTALAIGDHDQPVTAVLRRKDGSLEEVTCEYLIDCEGAHSLSRTTLGLDFKGRTRHESYVLGDVHIEGGPSEQELTIFNSPHGFMGLFPMQGGRFRLIASKESAEEPKAGDPPLEEIQAIYDQRSHIPGRFHDLAWSSYFRINSRMVHQLQRGRVFLGGDAAHIHSPAGGQGMNTGLQDMMNLGWKLALVLKGKASPKLLETYTEERVPVIEGVLEGTEELTNAIGTENPAARFLLKQLVPWLVGTDLVQSKATERMSQVLFDYRKSPLSKTVHAGGSLKAGDRVPNLPVRRHPSGVADGDSTAPDKLQSLLSAERLTLLLVNVTAGDELHDKLQQALAPWQELLAVEGVTAQEGQESHLAACFGKQPQLWLVRPDGYAAFAGSGSNVAELTQYLSTWFPTGQGQGSPELARP